MDSAAGDVRLSMGVSFLVGSLDRRLVDKVFTWCNIAVDISSVATMWKWTFHVCSASIYPIYFKIYFRPTWIFTWFKSTFIQPVYEGTDSEDPHWNYFPSGRGNIFALAKLSNCLFADFVMFFLSSVVESLDAFQAKITKVFSFFLTFN